MGDDPHALVAERGSRTCGVVVAAVADNEDLEWRFELLQPAADDAEVFGDARLLVERGDDQR